MIFVTVGTHEQSFNRLLEWIDELIQEHVITEDVIAQIGYSTYLPKLYKSKKFFDYQEMQNFYNDANIIITHGGPSSFIEALHTGKTPIVVPRQKKYNEHINDHQLIFCNELVKRGFPIKVVCSKKELIDAVLVLKSSSKKVYFKSNNKNFIDKLTYFVNTLFED